MDYSNALTPADYKCAKCGGTGCKLWREYQMFSPQLLCAGCACDDQKKTNNVDAEGWRTEDGRKLDQIGWYVPAVPTEDGIGYWGYSSVPEAGANWWRALPTAPH